MKAYSSLTYFETLQLCQLTELNPPKTFPDPPSHLNSTMVNPLPSHLSWKTLKLPPSSLSLYKRVIDFIFRKLVPKMKARSSLHFKVFDPLKSIKGDRYDRAFSWFDRGFSCFDKFSFN